MEESWLGESCLLTFIDELYEAALDEKLWQTMATRVARTLESNCSRSLEALFVGGAGPAGRKASGILRLRRPRSATESPSQDATRVARLLPHMRRALEIRDRLDGSATKEKLFQEALDRCGMGVILAAVDGTMRYVNERAQALLKNGAAIRSRQDRLTATAARESTQLAILIRAACCDSNSRAAEEGAMTIHDAAGQPLSVLVAPLLLDIAGDSPEFVAIVYVCDSQRSMLATATLRALFQLTPTEARVAQSLTNGKSLAEIAIAHGSAIETIRKQVKTIFTKTGTDRQADCVALILRSVAAIARG